MTAARAKETGRADVVSPDPRTPRAEGADGPRARATDFPSGPPHPSACRALPRYRIHHHHIDHYHRCVSFSLSIAVIRDDE
jgi:hypothetical protein